MEVVRNTAIYDPKNVLSQEDTRKLHLHSPLLSTLPKTSLLRNFYKGVEI